MSRARGIHSISWDKATTRVAWIFSLKLQIGVSAFPLKGKAAGTQMSLVFGGGVGSTSTFSNPIWLFDHVLSTFPPRVSSRKEKACALAFPLPRVEVVSSWTAYLVLRWRPVLSWFFPRVGFGFEYTCGGSSKVNRAPSSHLPPPPPYPCCRSMSSSAVSSVYICPAVPTSSSFLGATSPHFGRKIGDFIANTSQ